ncbi:hypothetical protein QJS04_geneDACA018372 [Acorus gramineus]|uniref:TF-B3 domain-containing protein n=1 Tax=Acorus gramineus TaxID=55184 RepID=A0AAV9A255_ACOGR|nr:hypothetical protein QJS04_geneDACA018372 [Acorus gramineus]
MGRLNFSVKLFNGSGCEKEYKSGTKVDVPPTTSPNRCTKQGSSDNECKITSKKWTTESTPLETKAIYQQNGNSFFEATIKLSNLSYSYMQIPCKFAAMNGFREKGEIMVRDPAGRKWQLKISHRGKLKSETSLSGEWLNLAKVNGLEVRDKPLKNAALETKLKSSFLLWIPRKFADLNCLRNGQEIMMRDPNRRLWKMNICRHGKKYERIFSGEWLNFA